MREFIETGRQAAYAEYGLEKTALGALPQADWWTRLKGWRPNWKQLGTTAKETLVGRPGMFWDQLKNDKLFSEGGMLRNAFSPGNLNTWGGKVNAALMYGMPAFNLYQAATAPPEFRGRAVGGMVGSTLGGIVGSPLGAIGQTVGGTLLGSLGGTVGKSFDHTPEPHPLQQQFAEPPPAGRVDDRGLLSARMSNVTGRPTQL